MKISVVLASSRTVELVGAALESLRPQCRAIGAELIVARSVPPAATDPAGLFDGCLVVRVQEGSSIPHIRGAGLSAATGEIVLLTEDNCRPCNNWIERLRSGFIGGAEVVGGTMGNAHPDSMVDSGAYYAEYGYFGPARREPGRGASPFVTGANVGYAAAAATEAAAGASAGEWEGEIHHRLAARGAQFILVPDAIVELNARTTIQEFCRDRFQHARDYGSIRRRGWSTPRRFAMAAMAPALSCLLTWRAWRYAGRATPGAFFRSLPLTLLFLSAWAAGEANAYLGEEAP